ncbi:MAG: hypothetical protein RL033_6326 [Pseudomonadota bacterium]
MHGYRCRFQGPPICGWRDGMPTPPGDYLCNCEHAFSLEIEGAGNCEAALEAACGVDLPEPP